MPWARKFPAPIALNDGRILETLADARAMIQSLPSRQQRAAHWHYASGLLIEAATSRGSLRLTEMQLLSALKAEGLV